MARILSLAVFVFINPSFMEFDGSVLFFVVPFFILVFIGLFFLIKNRYRHFKTEKMLLINKNEECQLLSQELEEAILARDKYKKSFDKVTSLKISSANSISDIQKIRGVFRTEDTEEIIDSFLIKEVESKEQEIIESILRLDNPKLSGDEGPH
ncbi:MAG: hypothetical protein M3Q24_00600 [bacterium]|nr:hypothetical protein [bacterium]